MSAPFTLYELVGERTCRIRIYDNKPFEEQVARLKEGLVRLSERYEGCRLRDITDFYLGLDANLNGDDLHPDMKARLIQDGMIDEEGKLIHARDS